MRARCFLETPTSSIVSGHRVALLHSFNSVDEVPALGWALGESLWLQWWVKMHMLPALTEYKSRGEDSL